MSAPDPSDLLAFPSDADRKRLDAALDEITTWAADNLPPGWDIRLGISECGWHLELEDPRGGDASEDMVSPDIWGLVEHAREHARESADDEETDR